MRTSFAFLAASLVAAIIAGAFALVGLALAAVTGEGGWTQIWPYLVVYAGALAGYFTGPGLRRRSPLARR